VCGGKLCTRFMELEIRKALQVGRVLKVHVAYPRRMNSH
jgi:hypothetical protein